MTGVGSIKHALLPSSFALALLFMLLPLPMDWRWARPEIIALLCLYWMFYYPERLGVGMAFVVGLLQDLVAGSVLGQHAFALVLMVYIAQLSHQRLRSYGNVQQMLWLLLLVGVYVLLLHWVSAFMGHNTSSPSHYAPVLISAIVWPLFRTGMDSLRQRWRML